MYDSIVVGSGFAGAVVANRLAEEANKRVLIIEKRDHIGGNAYDRYDSYGVLIHQYGPHIFHTNNREVFEYLSKFTTWYDYSHEVLAYINGQYVPVPFNLNTLNMVFEKDKAEALNKKLLENYKYGIKVPILNLKENPDKDIKDIADYVYNNIFLNYTIKQWGLSPKEIDKDVTSRVPVSISNDNRYFSDEFQGMPSEGYTEMIGRMLKHPNINISLNKDARDLLTFNNEEILFKNEVFTGEIIYTGAIDELFNYQFGGLPYRTLDFVFEHHNIEEYQPAAVVNYTVSEYYTRITEFKKLTGQSVTGTTILKEYPKAFEDEKKEIPYYPINNDLNNTLYNKYVDLIKNYDNLFLLGRLAEYKYYNMDLIVENALKLSDKLAKA